MTDNDYNIRIEKFQNKKRQLKNYINSTELIYPPIDVEWEVKKLILYLTDLQIELEVDNFLLSVQEELEIHGHTY